MEATCLNCGAKYNRPPSLIGSYCSKRCAYDARRQERTTQRRVRYAPKHELASASGYISEARIVLFERIGWGPHPCHWCGKFVDWQVGLRGQRPDTLVADHLNGDPLDDSSENLVPACGTCNGNRAHAVRDDEPHIVRQGRRLRAIERTCEQCDKTFLIEPAALKYGRGRFCGVPCKLRHQADHLEANERGTTG